MYVTAEEFDAHIKITTSLEEHYTREVVERIENMLAELK